MNTEHLSKETSDPTVELGIVAKVISKFKGLALKILGVAFVPILVLTVLASITLNSSFSVFEETAENRSQMDRSLELSLPDKYESIAPPSRSNDRT